MKGKRGDYCSVTRVRGGTAGERSGEVLSKGGKFCFKRWGVQTQKTESSFLKGERELDLSLSLAHRLSAPKSSEVVFSGWEIEKISSEVAKASTRINGQDFPRGEAPKC